MQVNDIIKLKIIDIDHEGLGIGKIDNFPIFVDNALPGETVTCIITRVTKNIATAKNLELLEKSSNREEYLCPHYLECGGCNMMHFKYDYELTCKKQFVINTLKKVGNITTKVNDVIRNDKTYNYRNKVIVPFANKGRIISGFYKENTHEVVEMEKCLIEPEITSRITKDFKELLMLNNISIYDEKSNTGLVRNIMYRTNIFNEIMVVVVLTKLNENIVSIMKKLKNKYNEIVSLYINVNDKQTNVVLSDDFYLIEGQKELLEEINGLKFLVSPNSFLQVNHDQCEKLYSKALEYCNLTGNENVIDAYCGIGSITLSLAKNAKHVYGIEIVPEAIKNANNNKLLNNITNVDFICGKCEDKIVELVSKEHQDVIVFDPPRKGCEQSFLDTVIKMRIPKIVYISCKTSTFARDARYLIDHGYELIEVTPVDLFSHSSHIETVCLLELKK